MNKTINQEELDILKSKIFKCFFDVPLFDSKEKRENLLEDIIIDFLSEKGITSETKPEIKFEELYNIIKFLVNLNG